MPPQEWLPTVAAEEVEEEVHAVDAESRHQDHPARQDSPASPAVMASQEDPATRDPMPPHHNSQRRAPRDARLASPPVRDPPAHPAQLEAQDSQEDQERMRMAADEAHPDQPVPLDPMDTQEKLASPADQELQDKCTMLPEARDHPAHPAPMDSPEDQDNPEAMAIQETLERQDHQEMPAAPEDQETQEAREAKEPQEAQEDMALATTAHHQGPRPAIKPQCGDSELTAVAAHRQMPPKHFPLS